MELEQAGPIYKSIWEDMDWDMSYDFETGSDNLVIPSGISDFRGMEDDDMYSFLKRLRVLIFEEFETREKLASEPWRVSIRVVKFVPKDGNK